MELMRGMLDQYSVSSLLYQGKEIPFSLLLTCAVQASSSYGIEIQNIYSCSVQVSSQSRNLIELKLTMMVTASVSSSLLPNHENSFSFLTIANIQASNGYSHENRLLLLATFIPTASLGTSKETYIVVIEVLLPQTATINSALSTQKELAYRFSTSTISVSYAYLYNRELWFQHFVSTYITGSQNTLKEQGFSFSDLAQVLSQIASSKETEITEIEAVFTDQASLTDALANFKEMGINIADVFTLSDLTYRGRETLVLFTQTLSPLEQQAIMKELIRIFGENIRVTILGSQQNEISIVLVEFLETAQVSATVEASGLAIPVEEPFGVAGAIAIIALALAVVAFAQKRKPQNQNQQD
jgi:hypothetical protein